MKPNLNADDDKGKGYGRDNIAYKGQGLEVPAKMLQKYREGRARQSVTKIQRGKGKTYIARLTDNRISIALPLSSWPVFATAAISILEEDILRCN